MPEAPKRVRLDIYIDPDTSDTLNHLAIVSGTAKRQLVDEALSLYLVSVGAATVDNYASQNARRRLTAGALATTRKKAHR